MERKGKKGSNAQERNIQVAVRCRSVKKKFHAPESHL